MITKFSRFKKTKLWITTINIISSIFILNAILYFWPLNLDLTSGKSHSLSGSSKEIVKNLEDIVNIKVFVSSNLPPQLAPIKETTKNLLTQYRRLGKGKIRITWVDPQKDKSAEQEAISSGIVPLRFSSVKKDQLQVVEGFFGLTINYQGEKEIIPALQEINNLEYQITAAIKKIQTGKMTKIAFSDGLGEKTSSEISEINNLISSYYLVGENNLSEKSATYENDIQTLIVLNPKQIVSEKAKFIIDQYLMNGKGVLFLLEKIDVNENLLATEINNNLDDFLKHYGIEIEKKLVIDTSAGFANFKTEQGNFILSYPFWVKTRPENANKDLPVTSSIESIILPWVSPLQLTKNAKPLLKSSPNADAINSFYNLSPTQNWESLFKNKNQFVLAAFQDQPVESFFDEKTFQKFAKEIKLDQFKNKTDAIKLAVVGDADFIDDKTIITNPENAQFFLNLIDYLSADTNLIAIRSKTVFSRPIKSLEENQKEPIKIGNIIAGPIIMTSLYFLMQQKRKNATKMLS